MEREPQEESNAGEAERMTQQRLLRHLDVMRVAHATSRPTSYPMQPGLHTAHRVREEHPHFYIRREWGQAVAQKALTTPEPQAAARTAEAFTRELSAALYQFAERATVLRLQNRVSSLESRVASLEAAGAQRIIRKERGTSRGESTSLGAVLDVVRDRLPGIRDEFARAFGITPSRLQLQFSQSMESSASARIHLLIDLAAADADQVRQARERGARAQFVGRLADILPPVSLELLEVDFRFPPS